MTRPRQDIPPAARRRVPSAWRRRGRSPMTGAGPDRRAARLPALLSALQAAGIDPGTPELMPDTGLAHDHVRLGGTGWIARLPKQSQMQLGAAENLAYQAACFERASASGHAPRLRPCCRPPRRCPAAGSSWRRSRGAPRGCPATCRRSWRRSRRSMACRCPRRPRARRCSTRPIRSPICWRKSTRRPRICRPRTADTRAIIERHLKALRDLAGAAARPPQRLISFDAHPGNFLITPSGRAVLVDLEKARYSAPPLDLAHATLYTSTTWDVASHAVLSPHEVAQACHDWLAHLPEAERAAQRGWILPMRRAMWLWSMTWCAKWRVLSDADAQAGPEGEDWASDKSEAALIAHVRTRVDHYLDPETASRIDREFGLLADLV